MSSMHSSQETYAAELSGLEIAVIGMAARFPSADGIESFWRLLREGREGLSVLSDEELDRAGISVDARNHPDYVRKRGVIARKRELDAELLGYTAQDAATMDPQFGVFHEVAWAALENAGYHSSKYDGLIGVYGGASGNLSWVHRVMEANGSLADYYSVTSLTESGYLSTRVAHKLDLTGPAISTNTTCSTSLVNIHLACQSLVTGECDIALAGGVSVSIDNKGYQYQENMVLSPDGSCRPFDAAANGTASGEGCGVLVLKRLEDAIADNDTIVAVIKGSAINNDGQRKVGFTAPSSDGQARVIRSALERAEVAADTIGYIEAHGTATKLGDPIEIAALKQVFEHAPAASCAIGSVKSNIGHLGEAAGVAGAIKTILSLRHRALPPSLNFITPNPLAGLDGSPFYVNTALRDWPARADAPRRAGVSSFGIGGTNAHVIFEESAYVPVSGPSRRHQLVCLSANSPSALDTLERGLIEHARQHPQAQLADLCYTLHLGRKDLPHRRAFVVDSLAALGARATAERPFIASGRAGAAAPKVCFLFPGQGAQYRDMGRELYQHEPVFRDTLDECFAIARGLSGVDFKAQLFAQDASGVAAEQLVQTELVQPLLFVFEYALARLLQHWGCEADAYLGHSVGEYVAACLAGVFSLEDALRVVIERGRLVQALPEGAMLAVPLGEAQVEALLDGGITIAAINSPERTVVSGDIDAVERLQQRLAAQGIESVRLHTSHAFHSHHLDPVLARFGELLRGVRLSAPRTPFLSNVTGAWISDAEATSPDYWVRHLRQAVRFADCVQTLCRDEAQVLVEVGPGRTLGSFALQHTATAQPKQYVSLVPAARARVPGADDERLFEGLCQLFAAGVGLDWRRFYDGQQRCRVPLATYPFEGHCHYPAELLRVRGTGARPVAMAVADASAGVAVADVPAPVAASAQDAGSVQDRLLAIWKKFLGVQEIAIDQDVFDLGVDSLLSIRVITQIRETFDADISLDTIFVLRTVAEQAAEIERRMGRHDEHSLPPIRAYDHNGMAPLSTSQKRLWIISQLERDQTAYNTGFCMFVKGADATVLERAFRTVIQRHSILRTLYTEVDGVPMQHVQDSFEFHLEHADVSHLDPTHRYAAGEQLWQQALMSPIDLRKDVMLRAKLVRYDEERHLLMVTQHHICSDNWSNNVLMKEISVLYDTYLAGGESELPPLPVQYIDYALWQNEWLQKQALETQIPYWRKTLAGIPHVHNLPLDRPRPKYQSYRGKQYSTRVDAGVLDGLNRVSQQNGATLFMAMQAAFSVFLARYSGESDIVLGFSVANRLQTELEGLIGFFVNALVLRSDLSGNPTFTDFLGQTRKNLLGTYANAHVPFETLVDELKPPRSMSYEPIIQIKLIYLDQSQDQGGRVASRTDQEKVTHADMQVPYSKYDLTLYFNVVDGELGLTWEYATDLFETETIQRMADNFETLLRSIIATPNQPIRSLALLAAPELQQQLRDGNAKAAALAMPQLPAVASARSDTSFEFSLFYFASDDGGRADDKYRLLIEGARFADRQGFDAVWTPERHFDAFGGAYPNPAITAAALASITQRIHVRAGSCVLPLHNPVRVAEDWSVIDNISGGRVGIGFAAGYSPRDFTLAPDNFETRRDVLIRDVQTVKALWRGEGVTMPNGKGELAEIKIRPRPIQPELPVWVTTVGSEDAFRHAGRMGDNILTHLMGQSLEDLAKKIVVYREERAAAGHPGSGTITLLVHTFIADNEQMIFDKVREPFKQYLIDSVGTPQAIARTLGLGDLGAAVSGEGEGRHSDIDAITEFAFRRYYQSNALLGTAERVLPLVHQIRASGVNEVACLIDFGVEPELVLESLPRLGRLRDLAIPESVAKVRADVPVALSAPAPAPAAEPAPAVTGETTETIDPTRCIHRLFEQVAAAHPDAVAVVYEGEQLSYGELNARANRIAHHLIAEHDAGPERRIGLCVGRSVAMIVGLLAILKSGAAYVPMEPGNPASRIGYLLEDGGIDVVLTREGDDACLEGTRAARVMLDRADGYAGYAAQDPHTDVATHHAAYMIYTSGSTGLPKGVVVEHRSAVNFWEVMAASTHSLCPPHAHVALNASFAFDMSLKGILQLLSGHCLHIIPQEIRPDGVRLMQFFRQHGIHAFDSTPSQLNALLAAGLLDGDDYHPLSVLLGGEPINATVWNQLRACRTTAFYNMYGPTECTVDATIGLIGADDTVPHIGRPIANAQIYLLDEYGQPVPRGAVGEIHVGGVGVARGYLNREELTAERFLRDPYGGVPDARLYRTGDLARWLDDGNLAYLGRNDLQVKLRGFRIELGEIESHLVAHAQVREAAVLAQGEDSAKFLVAYVVPADPDFEAAALQFELKRALTTVLPAYMVPQAFVFMSALPLNTNGKLDRLALAEEAYVRPSDDYQAPRTDTERTLAAIWRELMGLGDISVRANFFELGGQSLVAIRAVNEIARQLQIELETRFIFEYSTIEALAAYIDNMRWTLSSKVAGESELGEEEVELEI